MFLETILRMFLLLVALMSDQIDSTETNRTLFEQSGV